MVPKYFLAKQTHPNVTQPEATLVLCQEPKATAINYKIQSSSC